MNVADWRFALHLLRTRSWVDLPAWARSRLNPDYLLATPSPWLTFAAIRYVEKYLRGRRRARVFEYGSGGSTLYWLSRDCICTSVEHSAEWLAEVRARLPWQADLDLRCVPPESLDAGAPYDPADPALCQSSAFADRTFRAYVRQVDEFPEAHFDIVLVDGRARPSCLLHAHRKVRIGGLLVLDNSDRAHYLRNTLALLQDFERRTMRGPAPMVSFMTQTDVFVRHR